MISGGFGSIFSTHAFYHYNIYVMFSGHQGSAGAVKITKQLRKCSNAAVGDVSNLVDLVDILICTIVTDLFCDHLVMLKILSWNRLSTSVMSIANGSEVAILTGGVCNW